VQQAAAAEVVDDLIVHTFVVAEDHALKHFGDGFVEALVEVGPRGPPQPVDEPLDATPTADEAQVVERRGERDMLAAALEIAPIVETSVRRGLRQGLDLYALESEQRSLGERATMVDRHRSLVVEAQAQVGGLVDGGAVDARHPHGEVELVILLDREVDERRA